MVPGDSDGEKAGGVFVVGDGCVEGEAGFGFCGVGCVVGDGGWCAFGDGEGFGGGGLPVAGVGGCDVVGIVADGGVLFGAFVGGSGLVLGDGDVLDGAFWCGYVEVDIAYFGVVGDSCLYGGGAADGLFLGCGLWCAYGGWGNVEEGCVVLVLGVDGVVGGVDDAVAVVVEGAFAGFVEVIPVVAGEVGSADDVGA